MPNPDADPAAVERLTALRGASLTILAAFAIAAADLVGAYWLCSVTGYRQGTVGPTLANLAKLGFVEQVERYTWRLTPFGKQIGAHLIQALTHKKSESTPAAHQMALSPTHFKDESHSHRGALETPAILGAPAATHKKSESAGPTTTTIDTQSIVNSDLREQFALIFDAANIHRQMRQQLARELIQEDGPGWLREALGHLASVASENPKTRGATVWPALRDRQRADVLPPDGLNFAQAFAWAERGGQAMDQGKTPPPAAPPLAPADPITDDDAQQLPAAERLWRAVLEQLRMETPRSTWDTWLANTALVELEPGRYQVITPSPQAAAWLGNRLKAAIERTINTVSGAPAAVSFTYPGEPNANPNPTA